MNNRLAKFCIFPLLMLFMSLPAFAKDVVLNKELMDRFFSVGKQLEQLESKYPDLELEENVVDLLSNNGKPLADYIAQTPAHADVKKIVKSHGFSSLEEYTGLASRFLTAMFAVAAEQMPANMKANFDPQKIAEMRTQMLNAGMPQEMVNQQVQRMESAIASMEAASEAAKHATPADMSFVRDNWTYLEEQMNAAEEQMD